MVKHDLCKDNRRLDDLLLLRRFETPTSIEGLDDGCILLMVMFFVEGLCITPWKNGAKDVGKPRVRCFRASAL